jgi:hypothetical protein
MSVSAATLRVKRNAQIAELEKELTQLKKAKALEEDELKVERAKHAKEIAVLESMVIGCKFKAAHQHIDLDVKAWSTFGEHRWVNDSEQVHVMEMSGKWVVGVSQKSGKLLLVNDQRVEYDGDFTGTCEVYNADTIEILDRTPETLKVDLESLAYLPQE